MAIRKSLDPGGNFSNDAYAVVTAHDRLWMRFAGGDGIPESKMLVPPEDVAKEIADSCDKLVASVRDGVAQWDGIGHGHYGSKDSDTVSIHGIGLGVYWKRYERSGKIKNAIHLKAWPQHAVLTGSSEPDTKMLHLYRSPYSYGYRSYGEWHNRYAKTCTRTGSDTSAADALKRIALMAWDAQQRLNARVEEMRKLVTRLHVILGIKGDAKADAAGTPAYLIKWASWFTDEGSRILDDSAFNLVAHRSIRGARILRRMLTLVDGADRAWIETGKGFLPKFRNDPRTWITVRDRDIGQALMQYAGRGETEWGEEYTAKWCVYDLWSDGPIRPGTGPNTPWRAPENVLAVDDDVATNFFMLAGWQPDREEPGGNIAIHSEHLLLDDWVLVQSDCRFPPLYGDINGNQPVGRCIYVYFRGDMVGRALLDRPPKDDTRPEGYIRWLFSQHPDRPGVFTELLAQLEDSGAWRDMLQSNGRKHGTCPITTEPLEGASAEFGLSGNGAAMIGLGALLSADIVEANGEKRPLLFRAGKRHNPVVVNRDDREAIELLTILGATVMED